MTLAANSSGVLTGKFTIPAGVPAGSKEVVFTGAGGTVGRATFVGQGTSVIELRQLITTQVFQKYDPLAETFTLDQGEQIAGVDLWFTAAGSSPVDVQIREVSNGVPTQVVLASARLASTALAVDGTATRFNFARPVALQTGVEYAFVVMCDNATAACSIAELGKFDAVRQQWVTAQPYQVGVLLSSSNASSWTIHQDRDLAFRLVRASFSPTSKTVNLGTVAVTGATDMAVRANVETTTSNTSVKFRLTFPDATTAVVSADQVIRFDTPISGNVAVAAILEGTELESPVLHRDVQLLWGVIGTTGDYVSRAVPGGTGVKARVILEAYLPGTSAAVVSVKGIDEGDTWTPINVTASMNMDEGWVELTYESSTMTETAVRVKVALSGSAAYRPQVRNLRMYVL